MMIEHSEVMLFLVYSYLYLATLYYQMKKVLRFFKSTDSNLGQCNKDIALIQEVYYRRGDSNVYR